MKYLLYILSVIFVFCLIRTGYFGNQLKKHYPRSPSAVKDHTRWVAITVVVIILSVAAIEVFIIPHFKRHLTPLLKIHLSFCAAFAMSFIGTIYFNGHKWSPSHPFRHRIFAYSTILFGICVALTAWGVSYQL